MRSDRAVPDTLECRRDDCSAGRMRASGVAERDVYYVEFDEQGLLYPRGLPNVGIASCHIEALMRDLEGLAQKEPGLSIIVFVHGWSTTPPPTTTM